MCTTFKSSKKGAVAAGDLFYFTGTLCANGHLSKRYSRGGMCFDCLKMHRDANKEKNTARAVAHQRKNPESAKNRCLKWRGKNKHKANAIEAKRRAAKLNATPSWLTNEDLRKIDDLFEEATRLSEETGVKYHVDHIVPLQGETVGGLHVPWNLRVIPAFDNLSKHNKLIGLTA